MPTYPFTCADCSVSEDRFMSVAEYEATRDQLRCSRCEGHLRRIWTPVALKTDTRFFQGDDGFGADNRSRQLFRKKCAAAGIPISGKYFPQLCRTGVTLDPYAQASSTGEIKRKLRSLGRGCEGSINVKAPDADTDKKPYKLAENIVQREVRDTIINNKLRPTPKQRRELTETIRQELTPVT